MTIAVGDRIPDVSIVKVTPEGPDKTTTAAYFAGRTIALFSVPGAFTPTCSAKHLPGFIDKAEAIKAKGVDEIACTAVNDAFVLAAWGKANDAEGKIVMLADGNGDFVSALGLDSDSSAYGMGKRGKRFAMIVEDGVVKSLDVEAPGEFRVSAADYQLAAL